MIKNENNEKQWIDVRDGLTRKERVILFCLRNLQTEVGGHHVDTCMLYGRVVEYIDIGSEEMQSILQGLIARKAG